MLLHVVLPCKFNGDRKYRRPPLVQEGKSLLLNVMGCLFEEVVQEEIIRPRRNEQFNKHIDASQSIKLGASQTLIEFDAIEDMENVAGC